MMKAFSINKIRLQVYYQLTKPGIIYGNVLTATAAFIYASSGTVDFWLYITTISGIILIIACGCVINNFFDIKIDAKMSRTNSRALVTGAVSPTNALVFGVTLGILGFLLLVLFTNIQTVGVGLVGLFSYIVLYGYSKRKTSYGTLIGTISGATPPVAGYVAVTGNIDTVAALLFLMLVFWQMPHFYAIAIYRIKDYRAAKIPILPITDGIEVTSKSIILYIAAFMLTSAALTVRGYTGIVFLAVLLLVGLYWFKAALIGLKTKQPETWAKNIFRISLIVLLMFSLMLSLDHWLP